MAPTGHFTGMMAGLGFGILFTVSVAMVTQMMLDKSKTDIAIKTAELSVNALRACESAPDWERGQCVKDFVQIVMRRVMK
jgi:hypothetical protein